MDHSQPSMRQSLLVEPQRDSVSVPINHPIEPVAYNPAAHPPWVNKVLMAFTSYPKVLLLIVLMLFVMLIFSIVGLALLVATRNECEGPDGPGALSCGWDGKDLTALTTIDLTNTFGNNYYALRVCGVSTQCRGLGIPQAQACWSDTQTQSTAQLGSWVGPYSATGTWGNSPDGNGIMFSSQHGGQCADGSGLTIHFQCGQDQYDPLISNVAQVGCLYTFTVVTNLMC